MDPHLQEHLLREVKSALDKLAAGMKAGPDGVTTITNSEATLLYRLLTEQAGVRHPQ